MITNITNNIKKEIVYDKVIVAVNGDQVLGLFDKQFLQENKYYEDIFSKIKYTKSNVTIHRDSSFMPNNKFNWSSWNSTVNGENELPICTYWPYSLQKIKSKNLFTPSK